MEGISRKVLQPQSCNNIRNDTKRKMRKSSSLGNLTSNLNDANISNTTFTPSSPPPQRHRFSMCGVNKVNHLMESSVETKIVDLQCIILKSCSLLHKQKEMIQELEKRVAALQKYFDDAKSDVYSSLTTLNKIYYLEKIYQVEKKKKNIMSGLEILQPNFEPLITLIELEMNKIKLKNVSLAPKDDFSQTLNEAYNFIKALKMNETHDILKTIVSHSEELEKALGKFKTTNERSGELIEGIKKLLLHRKVLTIIAAENKQG